MGSIVDLQFTEIHVWAGPPSSGNNLESEQHPEEQTFAEDKFCRRQKCSTIGATQHSMGV